MKRQALPIEEKDSKRVSTEPNDNKKGKEEESFGVSVDNFRGDKIHCRPLPTWVITNNV